MQITHQVSSANVSRENDLLLSTCYVQDAIPIPSISQNPTSTSFRRYNHNCSCPKKLRRCDSCRGMQPSVGWCDDCYCLRQEAPLSLEKNGQRAVDDVLDLLLLNYYILYKNILQSHNQTPNGWEYTAHGGKHPQTAQGILKCSLLQTGV